jgi:hypothetical protein
VIRLVIFCLCQKSVQHIVYCYLCGCNWPNLWLYQWSLWSEPIVFVLFWVLWSDSLFQLYLCKDELKRQVKSMIDSMEQKASILHLIRLKSEVHCLSSQFVLDLCLPSPFLTSLVSINWNFQRGLVNYVVGAWCTEAGEY